MVDTMYMQHDEAWIAENVIPYKEEVDAFLEKASHPDKTEMMRIIKDAHKNKQIPKIINFCFINYKELLNCYYPVLHSWITNLSDYFFINWTPEILPDCKWTRYMLENKKWAFYADYARVYAVYNVGGFYIDCDAFVYKSFDDFLQYPYVFDTEYNTYIDPAFINRIEAGVFGAQTHYKPLKHIVDYYANLDEIYDNLGLYVAPFLWNDIFKMHKYIVSYRHKKEDYDKFLMNKTFAKLIDTTIVVLDGTYFSRPNTELINRCTVAQNIGIKEIGIEPDAYASHQMFSEWVPKKED